jgi:hypothetical protein
MGCNPEVAYSQRLASQSKIFIKINGIKHCLDDSSAMSDALERKSHRRSKGKPVPCCERFKSEF